MGIDLEFKQIPFELLKKLKEAPQAINLYIYAECSAPIKKLDISLEKNIIDLLLEQYNLMREYYQDTASKENAMLVYLT